jgi:hypothetical protein
MKRVQPELDPSVSAGGRTGASSRFAALRIPVLVAVFAGALSAIALWPVTAGNDQALFVYYASLIRQGATLYTDIWDNKQPGIFLFYAAAGALCGDGWPAARLGYALWLGAAAGVIAATLRRVVPDSPAWLLGSVLTVGLTLLRSDASRVAQVESLVGLPLVALLLLTLLEPDSTSGSRARWVAAGVLTGVVAALKLVLAPVAAVIIAVALGLRMSRRTLGPTGALAAIGLSAFGFTLVWIPIVAWLQASGAMPEFLWTMFAYPRLALEQIPVQNPAMLVGAFRWLLVTTALLLPAAALYVWQTRRRGLPLHTAMVLGCTGWIASGLVMIVMQRFSWWDTHMDLVVWPIGMLAALGLARYATSDITTSSAWDRRLGAAAAALAIVAILFHGGRFVRDVRSAQDWPRPPEAVASIETARRVMTSAVAPCGTVYAIGDQGGVERVTGLRQALPTHGLWFGAFLPAQARRLPDELRAARPDLVYFDRNEHRDFVSRYPDPAATLDRWLERDYDRLEVDAYGGQWWQRRVGPDDAATCPAATRFTIPAARPGA